MIDFQNASYIKLSQVDYGQVSDQIDSQWMAVGVSEQQQWETMLKMAAGAGSSRGGSVEFAKSMAQRWEFLRSVFSGSSSARSGSTQS